MTDGYKIKRVLTWVNGEEKQIYPALKWNGDLTKANLVSTTSFSGYIVYGIAFSNDGSKFYYQLNQNNNPGTFYQYDLSTPYDISTRSNSKSFTFYVGGYTYGVYPQNIYWSDDGKFLCHGYVGNSTGQITWYTLSTARDISTKTVGGNISMGNGVNSGVWFANNGQDFYYAHSNIGTNHASLSTPYTPTTGTQITSTGYSWWYISPDGLNLYYMPNATTITWGKMSTPYDFSNVTTVTTLTVNSGTTYSQGFYFDPTGDNLYVCTGGLNAPVIKKYSLT